MFLDIKLDVVFGTVNEKHDLSCVVASTSSSRREDESVLLSFMVLSSTMASLFMVLSMRGSSFLSTASSDERSDLSSFSPFYFDGGGEIGYSKEAAP